MAKFSVGYIVFCEWLFALMFGVLGVAVTLGAKTTREILFVVAVFSAIVVAIAASVLLLRRVKRAWAITTGFGIFVIALSVWIFWLAANADPRGDGGEIGVVGIGFLLCAVPAFVMLNLPQTTQYLSSREHL